MSSFHHLREFISSRLTAAAEEIFTEFEKIIEEEIDRRSRMLEITRKPHKEFPTADFPQNHEERTSITKREENKGELQIKEEPTEIWNDLKEEELESFTTADCHQDADISEQQKDGETQHDDSGSAAESGTESERNNVENSAKSANPPKPATCDFCGKTFASKRNMLDHKRIHTGEKPFPCTTCGNYFFRKEALAIHNRIHSDKQLLHSCKVCGKNYRHLSSLCRHARLHDNEKCFTCETCGKAFGTSAGYASHMRIHAGEKPGGEKPS